MEKTKPILHISCDMYTFKEKDELLIQFKKQLGDEYHIVLTDDNIKIKVHYSNFFVYCYSLIKSLKSSFIIRKKISI